VGSQSPGAARRCPGGRIRLAEDVKRKGVLMDNTNYDARLDAIERSLTPTGRWRRRLGLSGAASCVWWALYMPLNRSTRDSYTRWP